MLAVLVGICGVIIAGYTVLYPSKDTKLSGIYVLPFFAILFGIAKAITLYSRQSIRLQKKRKNTMFYNAVPTEILRRSKNQCSGT